MADRTAAFLAPQHGSAADDALGAALRRATLGEYDVLGLLGRGGMAAVYLAHDIALDRKVAIKVLAPGYAPNPSLGERFLREARIAASLTHPSIVPIHAVRRSGELLWFVMQFVDGRALDAVIEEHGALPLEAVAAVVHQVGGALAFAHRKGAIHRDIKPANILLDVEGQALVTDFGIAKMGDAPGLTQTGATVGTPSHMSPEQCKGGEVTAASDQYSFAMVLYEMLAGETAFAGDTSLSLFYSHVHEPPPPLQSRRPDCPPALAVAIHRMLSKEPRDRFADLGEAVAAMQLAYEPEAQRAALAALAAGHAPAGRVSRTPQSPIPLARDAGQAATTVVSARPRSLVVSPAQCTCTVGDAVQLAATARDGNGNLLTSGAVTWATSDGAVAVVSPAGLVTAVAGGEAVITAVLDGLAATARIVVNVARRRETPMPRAQGPLALLPAGGTMAIGQTARLQAVRRASAGGDAVPVEEPVEWRSDAPAVVRVTPEGEVVADGLGQATVTARLGAEEVAVRFTVTRVEVARVQLTPSSVSVRVGDDVHLHAWTLDRLGARLAGRLIGWQSSDPAVAVVDGSGHLVAVGPGTAEVTAACGAASARTIVRVLPAVVANVVVNPLTALLRVGETFPVQVSVLNEAGRELRGIEVAWVTSDPAIVTVDGEGVLQAQREGTARVAAVVGTRRAIVRIEVRRPRR